MNLKSQLNRLLKLFECGLLWFSLSINLNWRSAVFLKKAALVYEATGSRQGADKRHASPHTEAPFLSLNGTDMFQKQLREKFKMPELCYTGVFSFQHVS